MLFFSPAVVQQLCYPANNGNKAGKDSCCRPVGILVICDNRAKLYNKRERLVKLQHKCIIAAKQ